MNSMLPYTAMVAGYLPMHSQTLLYKVHVLNTAATTILNRVRFTKNETGKVSATDAGKLISSYYDSGFVVYSCHTAAMTILSRMNVLSGYTPWQRIDGRNHTGVCHSWLTCRPTVDNKSKSACNLILDVLPIGMGYPILLAVDPMFRKKDHPSYIPDPYWIPMQYIDTAELESAYIIEHLDNELDMLHWKI